MEVKEEIAQLEGQWRSFADYKHEMSCWASLDDQQNDHDEYLKKQLLIELKQVLANKF